MTVYGSRNWECGLLNLSSELELESWRLSIALKTFPLVVFFLLINYALFPKTVPSAGDEVFTYMNIWEWEFHIQIIRAEVHLLSKPSWCSG